jgi:hypothetical protein
VFEAHLHSLLDVLIVVVEVDEHGLQHVLENGLRLFQRGAVEEYVNCLGRFLPDRILGVVEPFDEAGVQIPHVLLRDVLLRQLQELLHQLARCKPQLRRPVICEAILQRWQQFFETRQHSMTIDNSLSHHMNDVDDACFSNLYLWLSHFPLD